MSQALVASVKADLEARGVNTSGACGAFQIVHHVAWALRAQGAGLLVKRTHVGHPDGPQQSPFGCWRDGNLFACDPVIFPSGEHFDALGDGGGRNDPQWHRVLIEGTDQPFLRPNAYHAVWPPADLFEPEPEPEPNPTPTPPDVSLAFAAILGRLDEFKVSLDSLLARQQRGLTGSIFGYTITLRPPA